MNRIEIRGVIVDSIWDADWAKSYIERGIITPESAFRRNLSKVTGEAEVYVNSPGGSVFSAYEMLNTLIGWISAGNRAVIKVGAMAASAASMLAVLSGLPIVAHRNSKFMFHGAWTGVVGGSEALKDEAELLEKINGEIKTALIGKYNLAPERVAEWFAEGRMGWLTAAEAKEIGMVREIVGEDDAVIKFNQSDLAIEQRGLKIAALLEIKEESENGENAETTYQTGSATGHDAAGNNVSTDTAAGTPSVHSEIEKLLTQIGGMNLEKDKSDLEITLLKKQTESANARIAEMESGLSAAKSDIEKRDQLISKLQSERDQFRSQLNAVEAKHSKLLGGAMTFHYELDSWGEALAHCGGDYVKARKMYPELFKKYMNR